MNPEMPYNPLDKHNLGKSVADALLARQNTALGEIEAFSGAGIYAIYYSGKFRPYAAISSRSDVLQREIPIYVGKAVPPGARKGNFGLNSDPGQALFRRLKEHAESIRLATNLEVRDFHCRYLVVDDIWIPLGEALLIAKFSPLWNKIIDGFGNHDPGSGRYNQLRSRWDTLHPGRPWAFKCQERPETQIQIIEELRAYLLTAPDTIIGDE
ncbi:Eco29kI family restriction endonuclease [Desulforhabdus sp. TSK]|uniref:Eco29kI family restriction endonuclease n=1 Tax=Desulforhabdus sp. TSK TaxID=2925014 RepID=UPI001FC8079A|nr:Eco29kI family restriction endonuclease [Desulforhabdus sp. TSK]GKT08478.1 type II restriction-modification system endonuclease [Desulforhabdus sp. TSK]